MEYTENKPQKIKKVNEKNGIYLFMHIVDFFVQYFIQKASIFHKKNLILLIYFR